MKIFSKLALLLILQFTFLYANNIKMISAGGYHSLILKNDGSLYSVGRNNYGQLGDGTTTQRTTPVKIMDSVSSIATGGYHSLILKNDDSLYGVGSNGFGQLGDGTTTQRTTPVKIMDSVSSIATGGYHSLILKTDGSLYSVGRNSDGQLGDGTKTHRTTPVKIMDSVSSIIAGGYHSLILKNDDSLYGVGSNGFGQLGDGTTTQRTTPVKIMDSVGSIAAGDVHSLILKTDGSLYSVGSNSDGELGDGTKTHRTTPVKIMDSVGSIAAGVYYSLILKTGGSLYGVGRNYNGQLGDGTTISGNTPVKVLLPESDSSGTTPSPTIPVSLNKAVQISLKSGWNLLSLPSKYTLLMEGSFPLSKYVNSYFKNYSSIWTYESNKWYSTQAGFGELKRLVYGQGFWLNSNSSYTVTFDGDSYSPTIPTSIGWHLLGTGNSLNNLSSSRSDIVYVYTYKNGQWIKNTATIESGQGFWVRIGSSLNNSPLLDTLKSELLYDDLPLNEDIVLAPNVKIISENELSSMEIREGSAYGTYEIMMKNTSTRGVLDDIVYKVGDIFVGATTSAADAVAPWADYPMEIIGVTGEKIVISQLNNICKLFKEGTVAYNPKQYKPHTENEYIIYKIHKGEVNLLPFLETVVDTGILNSSSLDFDLAPSFTIQCKNNNLVFVDAGLAGDIKWTMKFADYLTTREVEVPIVPVTQINVGKAKIGLFVEFRPTLSLSQNIFETPTLTVEKKFSIVNRYRDGYWQEVKESDVYPDDRTPLLTGIKTDTLSPTVSLELDGKFFIGLGGKLLKKDLEGGFSVALQPRFSLKKTDLCWSLVHDFDAKMQLELNTFLKDFTYSNKYFDYTLIQNHPLWEFNCYVENTLPQAKISVSSTSTTEGDSITFDARSSSDSDGSITKYYWSSNLSGYLSSSSSFSKSNLSVGTHTITLTVTDDEGDKDSNSITVTVKQKSEPAQTASNWVIPSKAVCEANGGMFFSFGACTANWENAKKICLESGTRLPTIDELKAVAEGCGSVATASVNVHNEEYQSCYKNLGFSAVGYWSSTTTYSDSIYAYGEYFYYGNEKMYLRTLTKRFLCISQ